MPEGLPPSSAEPPPPQKNKWWVSNNSNGSNGSNGSSYPPKNEDFKEGSKEAAVPGSDSEGFVKALRLALDGKARTTPSGMHACISQT